MPTTALILRTLWSVYADELDPIERAVDAMLAALRVDDRQHAPCLTSAPTSIAPQFADARRRRWRPFTWFRVGGPAELLFQPADADDLALFLQKLNPEVPVNVVGVGSNLLVRDGGVRGVVIRLSAKGFGQVERGGRRSHPRRRGLPDKRLAAFALEQGLGGFAFFHGIPGTVGGALRMNAGANGVETRERLVEANAIDRRGARKRSPTPTWASPIGTAPRPPT